MTSTVTQTMKAHAFIVCVPVGSIQNLRNQKQKLRLFYTQIHSLQLETSKYEATGAVWALDNPLTNTHFRTLEKQIHTITFPDGIHIKYLPPNKPGISRSSCL